MANCITLNKCDCILSTAKVMDLAVYQQHSVLRSLRMWHASFVTCGAGLNLFILYQRHYVIKGDSAALSLADVLTI